ncbi:hypothetical protein LINGRAHAP2_LOCUS21070 [Linum grandiflorum]
MFRLLHSWDEPEVHDGHEVQTVYSQWIDIAVHISDFPPKQGFSTFHPNHTFPIIFQEHRIEGYTEPGQAEAVRDLLIPGLIYKIQNPFLVPARQVLRSCPGDFALAIRPADLLTKISENVPRPFFPLQSFSIPTMPSMRAINQPRTTSLDIIGRLSGVTRPTPSPPEGYSFRILLDHPSNERLLVRYSHFRHLTPLDLNGIVDMERHQPVICILTAVTITNPGADALILENTPASRIVFPPFSSPYRPCFDL